ncbi:MAG TPA: hypothetical protein VFN31_01355 [Candidatus Saccharimonadales bacterium]|nr:hypothetical protein [Candidatus Saccharimonadales bacterium]
MSANEQNSIGNNLPLDIIGRYENLVEEARVSDIVSDAAVDAWGIDAARKATDRSIKIARNFGQEILSTPDVASLPPYQQAALAEAMDIRLRHRHVATYAISESAKHDIKTTVDYFKERAEELQPIAEAIHTKLGAEGGSVDTLIFKLEDNKRQVERYQIEELSRNGGEPSLIPKAIVIFIQKTGRSINYRSTPPVPVNDFYFNRETQRFRTIKRQYILEPRRLTFDIARCIYDPFDTTAGPYSYGLIGHDVIAKLEQTLLDSGDPQALELLSEIPQAED